MLEVNRLAAPILAISFHAQLPFFCIFLGRQKRKGGSLRGRAVYSGGGPQRDGRRKELVLR